jgi:hypothetical protein
MNMISIEERHIRLTQRPITGEMVGKRRRSQLGREVSDAGSHDIANSIVDELFDRERGRIELELRIRSPQNRNEAGRDQSLCACFQRLQDPGLRIPGASTKIVGTPCHRNIDHEWRDEAGIKVRKKTRDSIDGALAADAPGLAGSGGLDAFAAPLESA